MVRGCTLPIKSLMRATVCGSVLANLCDWNKRTSKGVVFLSHVPRYWTCICERARKAFWWRLLFVDPTGVHAINGLRNSCVKRSHVHYKDTTYVSYSTVPYITSFCTLRTQYSTLPTVLALGACLQPIPTKTQLDDQNWESVAMNIAIWTATALYVVIWEGRAIWYCNIYCNILQ